MKNQKGITLVALVITIIVLLILAGVSISLVIGNNGVLTQASNAVVTNNKAAAKQDINMAVASCYANWMEARTGNQNLDPDDYFEADDISGYLSDTSATITEISSGNSLTVTLGDDDIGAYSYSIDGKVDTIYFKVSKNGAVTYNDEASTKFVTTAASPSNADPSEPESNP